MVPGVNIWSGIEVQEVEKHFKFIKKRVSVQFNSERFVKMDLNTATYSELVTLLNIGEVRAASIVMVRESLERIGRKLTLLDLTLDCGIPGDVVKDLTVNGDIQPIPRHKDSCKSDQTSTLLVSIAASIQALSEVVDIVNDRQALFESALKAAGLDVTGANAHVTNPIDKVEFMSLSRQDSQHQQYRVEELTEARTTVSHHDYEHQDGKPEQSCYQLSFIEIDWSDDLDAALEEQLELIRQFKLPGEEEETVHECRCSGSNSRVIRHPELSRSRQESIMVDADCCGSINSRVMRHPEFNEMCPGPRPIFRPCPNKAHSEEFSPSVGGPRSSRADWNRWSRIRVPEFKGNRSSWHSYLVQFNTIMKMNDCDDNEVKACKLVEALRGKALDYFESLPKELRLEFESLCSMFEGRFGRQEAPATMRRKLKCITQGVEETLAEFGERALKVTLA